MFTIREDDLEHPGTQALLSQHLHGMRETSPAGSVFALDLSALRSSDLTVWTAWVEDRIAGVAALKTHPGKLGELKSMRTSTDFLRRGVATALLYHIIAVAKARRLIRLSLETGSGAAFEPAISLYRRCGFIQGEPFSDYRASAFNQFLHLDLEAAP